MKVLKMMSWWSTSINLCTLLAIAAVPFRQTYYRTGYDILDVAANTVE